MANAHLCAQEMRKPFIGLANKLRSHSLRKGVRGKPGCPPST